MSNIFDFLKKLFRQWYIYLNIIPGFFGVLNIFSKIQFQLPTWFIILFAISTLLFASFKAYEEEYKIRIELEKKLKGPTNYEITAILTPIDFEVNKELKYIDENKDKATKKLKEIELYLAGKLTKSDIGIEVTILTLESIENKQFNKTQEQYDNELLSYKSKLEDYIKNYESYKTILRETISKWQKQYYFIKFIVENIGIKSDTDIQISIYCNDRSIVFKKNEFIEYGIDSSALVPRLPKKPKKQKFVPDVAFLPNQFDIDFHSIMYPDAFRKWIDIKDNECSITLSNLQVGDEVDIFDKFMIIKTDLNTPEFKVTIKSKESTRKLHPMVNVKFEEIPTSLNHKN